MTDKMFRERFGIDGLSFNKKVYDSRSFNGDRYIKVYSDLANAEYKTKAEVLVYTAEITRYNQAMAEAKKVGDKKAYKAYSEDLSDMLTKVRDAGKDLWRLIKKLLGKLIIFLEEQLAYIFSKVNVAEKLAEKVALQIAKFAKWGNPRGVGGISFRSAFGTSTTDRIVPEDIGSWSIDWFRNEQLTEALRCIINDPNRLNAWINGTDSGMGDRRLWGVDKSDITNVENVLSTNPTSTNPADFYTEIDRALSTGAGIGIFRVMSALRDKNANKEKRLKALAKDFKYAAKVYKHYSRAASRDLANFETNLTNMSNTMFGVTPAGATVQDNGQSSLSNTAVLESKKILIGKDAKAFKEDMSNPVNLVRDTAGNVADTHGAHPYVAVFINLGALLEIVIEFVKHKISSKPLKYMADYKSLDFDTDQYDAGLAEIFLTSRKILFCLAITIQNYKNMRDIYFDYRRRANELKNAPTEITNNYDPETLQGVRMLISRSTKAAHWLLKYTSSNMTYYLHMTKHVSYVLETVDKKLSVENERETAYMKIK